jgi:hypothetical protein
MRSGQLPKSPASSSRYDASPKHLQDRRTYGPENLCPAMQKDFFDSIDPNRTSDESTTCTRFDSVTLQSLR